MRGLAVALLQLALLPLLGAAARRGVHGLHGVPEFEASGDASAVQTLFYAGAVADNFAEPDAQAAWWSAGQRYMVNDEFWAGEGSPVFLWLGGEAPLTTARLTNATYMYSLAQDHSALMVGLEHRFYGESYPAADMSAANLTLLSPEQALADAARFVDWFAAEQGTGASAPWIVVGGSYPGCLSAWLRGKYPHLIAGSWASSAPVQATLDFDAYLEVVGDALNTFGAADNCYDNVELAAEALAALVATEEGFATLGDRLPLCSEPALTFGDAHDLFGLWSELVGAVQGVVQYNAEVAGQLTVSDLCDTMAAGLDPLTQFAAFQQAYLDQAGEACIDGSWQSLVDELSVEAFDGSANERQWTHQTCRSFGYYQTTGLGPFSALAELDLAGYDDLCDEVFGMADEPDTAFVNVYYGATAPASTRTLYVNGDVDPWHALGITTGDDALLIEGTAHCADLRAPAEDDPASLTLARETIAAAVQGWVDEAGSGSGSSGGGGDDDDGGGCSATDAGLAGSDLALALSGCLLGGGVLGAAVFALANARSKRRQFTMLEQDLYNDST